MLEKIISQSSKIEIYHKSFINYTYENGEPMQGIITLDINSIDYRENQRVFIEIEIEKHSFSENIIPQFSSGVTTLNGWKTSYPNLFDRNDSTYQRQGSNGGWLGITLPPKYAIKPSKLRIKSSIDYGDQTGVLTENATTITGETITLYKRNFSSDTEFDSVVSVTTDKYIKSLSQNYSLKYSSCEHYSLEIVEGVYIEDTNNIPIYININGLGEKLITGDTLEDGKKYELIYDGTTFVAHLIPNY